eukprot:5712941-Amphidinium_carterae.2
MDCISPGSLWSPGPPMHDVPPCVEGWQPPLIHDTSENQMGEHFAVISSVLSKDICRNGVTPSHEASTLDMLHANTRAIPRIGPSRKKATKSKKHTLQLLRVATINVRSILCDEDPGSDTTARSQLLRKELCENGFQVAFVQETKLHSKHTCDNDDFWIVAASPRDRVGGLQTHLAKGVGITLLWTHEVCSRVLVTGIRWGTESWCLINAYSPTSVSSDDDFINFWQAMEEAFHLARKNGMLILCGADLNNKLGGAQDGIRVGPAVIGCAPSETKWRVEMILESMSKFRLSAWSTMVGMPHTTWTSPHGTESQIDYILGEVNRLDRVGAGGVRDLELFPSDHRMVWLTVHPAEGNDSAMVVSSAKHRPLRLRGPDHELAVKLSLASADHTEWAREDDPVVAMGKCMKLVRRTIATAPGNEIAVRKSWVGETAWKEIRIGAAIRRQLCKAARRVQRASKIWAWKCLLQTGRLSTTEMVLDIGFCLMRWRCFSVHLIVAKCAYRNQHKKTQKLVREDKKSWMTNKLRELNRLTCEGTSSTLHRQVKSCLTKVNCGRAATVRAPLQDMNNRWCITDDEKTILWQRHWCQLYGAKMASQERSFKSCKMPERALDV